MEYATEEVITTSSLGYGVVGNTIERVSSILEDISIVIGEKKNEEIILQSGDILKPGIGLKNEADHLYDLATDLKNGIFKVVVVGRFNVGKSTLLNAILNEEALPVKNVPTTAIITHIKYGSRLDVLIFESGKKEPRIMKWDDFVSEFQIKDNDEEEFKRTGSVERLINVKYAQIERKHRLLKNGVILIDTPGLEENIIREKLTMNYLKRANAVIMLLDANCLFDKNEKDLIKQILSEDRQMVNNIFFVINKIDNMDNEDEAKNIYKRVATYLCEYFLDEYGKINKELYNKHIFYVSAKKAMKARSNSNRELEKESRILLFEKALEVFLTQDEKVNAVIKDVVNKSRREIWGANRQIGDSILATEKTISELKIGREKSENLLRKLELDKNDINREIRKRGDKISVNIYNDIRDYIDDMLEDSSWEDDSADLFKLEEINIIEMLTEGNLQNLMNRNICRYLDKKLKSLVSLKNMQIRDEISDLNKGLDPMIKSFEQNLLYSKDLFIYSENIVNPSPIEMPVTPNDEIINLRNLLNNESIYDNLIQRILQDILSVGGIGGLVGYLVLRGPIPAVVSGIISALIAVSDKEKIRSYLITFTRNTLRENLPKILVESKKKIVDPIKIQFQKIAEETSGTLQESIDQVRENQIRFIEEKSNESYSAISEKERLDKIALILKGRLNQLESASHIRAQ